MTKPRSTKFSAKDLESSSLEPTVKFPPWKYNARTQLVLVNNTETHEQERHNRLWGTKEQFTDLMDVFALHCSCCNIHPPLSDPLRL